MVSNNKRGMKYFKMVNDELFVIRIGKVKGNEYSAKVIDRKNEYIKVTDEILKKDYILLNPDGYITFSIVSLNHKTQDVIVCLHRNEDMSTGALPYAICRQSVQDVFSQPFTEGQQIMYVGCSMSQDTCPKGVDFRAMTSCNSMDSMQSVAIYIDDTLESILSLINKKKFDSTLLSSNTMSLKAYKEMHDMAMAKRMFNGADTVAIPPKPIGYTNTLEDLLTANSFMYDFYKAYNIVIADFEIKEDMFSKENMTDSMMKFRYFENIIKHDILNIYIVPFSKSINLKEIRRSYMIVVDSNDKLWLVAYDLSTTDSRTSYETIHEREIYMNMVSKRKL